MDGNIAVMYVDDDENVRSFMVKFLQSLGCRVQAPASVKEAVKLLQRESFDLVMTDMEMPTLTGRELALIAKGWQPQCRVILLTGSMTPLDAEVEKSNGIDG